MCFTKLTKTNFIGILYYYYDSVYTVCFSILRWHVDGGAMDMRKELKGLTWGVG